jgi:hypothetical protein
MGHFFFKFAQEFRIFLDQLEIGLQLLDGEAQLVIHQQEAVQDLFFLLQAGRFLGLVPDDGIGQLEVDFFYAVGFFGDFKETPEGRWLFSSIQQRGFLSVPVPWLDCSGFPHCRQGELFTMILKAGTRSRGTRRPCVPCNGDWWKRILEILLGKEAGIS